MPKDAPTYSDWLKSIKETKEDLWAEFEGDDADEKRFAMSYSPYLITRALMTHKNHRLLHALNKLVGMGQGLKMFMSQDQKDMGLGEIDKKMHYHYLLHSIPKGQTYKSVSKSKEKKRKEKKEALQKEIQKDIEKHKRGGMNAALKF